MVPTNIYSLLERPISSMQFSYALAALHILSVSDTRHHHIHSMYAMRAGTIVWPLCRFVHIEIDIAIIIRYVFIGTCGTVHIEQQTILFGGVWLSFCGETGTAFG